MFRTLRDRLVLSHILPLIIVVPLMYLALSYLLETRFLIPRLAQDLFNDARLLTEIARLDYLTYGDQRSLQLYLLQLQPNPQVRLVYLKPDGSVVYSNDPNYLKQAGTKINIPNLDQAQQGEDVLQTNYSLLAGDQYTISVLLPVTVRNNQVIGILWMTYYEASLTNLFKQMRLLSILVTIASLILGALLGSFLAINIGRPVRKATEAIRSLARGERSDVLIEEGPDEVRDLVREVNVLVTRLHSLEQARRQLLANLVHELGRPLGALRSAIQALNRGASDDPKLFKELTTGMDEETARLQDILEDLAHLHDQVLGSLELKLEPVALSEWLKRTLLPWQEAAVEKRVDWQNEFPDDLPVVQFDPMRFAQVIGNLASNAVKYTPNGGRVTVSTELQDAEISISIRDTGPGIPLEEQTRIFQPFFQGTYAQRVKQGMGLGLSIAQDLANAHGGRITVESKPGEGSKFTVWLPLAKSAS
jgi:signal transduction histidine kinase